MTEMTEGIEVRRRHRCGNCKWFDGGNEPGPCRRHPPPPDPPVPMLLDQPPHGHSRFRELARVGEPATQFVYDMSESIDNEFRHPWVKPDDWCGEWAAASDEDWEPVPQAAGQREAGEL